MLVIDENGDTVEESSPKRKLGSVVHKLGYHYCVVACKQLDALHQPAPENPMLLREGSGKSMIDRIKKYGVDEVLRRLNIYIKSEKFIKYPSLVTALDRDTYLKIERGEPIC